MNSNQPTRPLKVPLTLEEFVEPQTTALIMWDMQKGLAGKSNRLDRVTDAAGRLLRAADKANVLVIWSRHLLPAFDLTVGPFCSF